jgi:Holliday junction resolvase RusA-like endonuclease
MPRIRSTSSARASTQGSNGSSPSPLFRASGVIRATDDGHGSFAVLIEGPPTPQPRETFSPLVNKRTGQLVRGANGRPVMTSFIPARKRADGTKVEHPIHAFKAALLAAFRAAAEKAGAATAFPLAQPIQMRARFLYERMKSVRWPLDERGVEPTSAVDDIDNLQKAVLDALTAPRTVADRNGTYLLTDDRFVYSVRAEKTVDEGTERCEIVFRW